MKLRRALATVAALAAAATTTIGLATPASAAGSCYAYTYSKVRIVSAYQQVPVIYGESCQLASTSFAGWIITRGGKSAEALGGFAYSTEADYPTDTFWEAYDDMPLGRSQVLGVLAYDTNDNSLAQNNATTDLRVGSWASISAVRSGSKVTLTTYTNRWGTSSSSVIPYGGVTGLIQYYDRSKGAWAPLKNATQNSSGAYTYTYNATAGLSYRVVFPDAPYIWGATSNTVYK